MAKFSDRIPEGFTLGEWWWEGRMLRCSDNNKCEILLISDDYYQFIMHPPILNPNLKLIALAPKMVEEIIKLEKQVERLEGEVRVELSCNAKRHEIIREILTKLKENDNGNIID